MEAVHLLDAEISGDWIDLDLLDVADPEDRLPQQIEIVH